ncbi:MAG: hypothetical protein QOF14_5926 [Hyphomicrobiales bacterium]|jgi:hypothetical protein|nr:hypothetical protein [Hyphomicrobiales bacterium]
MTKLLEQAIAEALALPDEEQDALAIAMLSISERYMRVRYTKRAFAELGLETHTAESNPLLD